MGGCYHPSIRLKPQVRSPITLDLTPLADLYNLQVGPYRNAVEFRFNV